MLIIVESPVKARKIQALLGIKTIPTVGHYRDLPVDSMGVDLKTYEPTFVVNEKKKSLPNDLRAAAKGHDVVLIATDPDREGFAIATHIYDDIKGVASSCKRVEFFEITEKGLRDSIAKAIPWANTNAGYYNAFLGRRVGDRLVGYILSPIAGKELHCKASVGRVQSPAVRLVVDREREIRNFKATPFWVLAIVLDKGETSFLAHHMNGKFEQIADAQTVIAAIKGETHALAEKVDKRETKQNPRAPFSTVDMQAAAAATLKFSPENTMKLAQDLFSCGLITYHRTDAVRMDDDFIEEIRAYVGKTLGASYLPTKPHQYKSKNSQVEGGAHEGIRPTHIHSTTEIPARIGKEGLGPDHVKLYELIFRRAVASQLAPALYDSTTYIFDVAKEKFKASGRVLKFDGFLKIYTEVEEEHSKKDDDQVQTLPPVAVGERVLKTKELLEEKKTKAPGRFTLGSLVKELERLEIGRPSTYASITKNITDRGYVKEEKGKVVPFDLGEKLIDYLRLKHGWVIDYELTSKMEAFLDLVSNNSESWIRFVKGVHAKMGYIVPPARGEGSSPREPQLKYANDLAVKNSLTIPEETLANSQLLSKWIESVAGKGKPVKPASSSSKSGKSPKAASAPSGEDLGACPTCGQPVKEQEKAYSCTARCGFALWKNKLDRFGKDITPSLAKRFIKGGPVILRGLSSPNKKDFDANGHLHNDPQYGWGIKLTFDVKDAKKDAAAAPKGKPGTAPNKSRSNFNKNW